MVLVGGGNVGQPLAEMARLVGFRVHVVDIDSSRRSVEALDQISIDAHSYVVIMTAEQNADQEALLAVVERPAAYIGMIGSRRKVAIIMQNLREAGIPEEALQQVHAPIGLDLGGRRPAEVALAVLSEMVAVRYGGSGRPLSAAL
jgi:xanthine dehydrogenase accessory factor